MLHKALLNKIKLKKKEKKRRVINQFIKKYLHHPIQDLIHGGGGVVQTIQRVVVLFVPTIFRAKRTNAINKLVRDWPKKHN